MRFHQFLIALVLSCLGAVCASAQVVMTGHVKAPRYPGSTELVPMTAVRGFASLTGSDSQSLGTRTWEMAPSGWYHFSGSAGRYTMLFSTPALPMRPLVLTNIFTEAGTSIDQLHSPNFMHHVFDDSGWDEKPAEHYYQLFAANGASVTQVGFKLAHDGVDGGGPDGQDLMLSIHRKGPGTPDKWPQVGPAMPVLGVDCGGPKNYSYSAGWNSGEVPTRPGEVYAVHLYSAKRGGKFQAFWRDQIQGMGDCYRVGAEGGAYTGKQIWLEVGGDNDGLLIPYNKRVHREFVELTRFGPKWTQTYVAKGKGLAGVILYAAASGVQPNQNRQRVRVRVRYGGPGGAQVGIDKIATGNATHTGDSSWGTFGCAYAPGEVALEPGRTYAIEFESMESFETLHGYVNIKGMPSDDKPGFNPYRKTAPDDYSPGTAYFGEEKMDFDLDMQVIEYVAPRSDWNLAVEPANHISNGRMEYGEAAHEDHGGKPVGWSCFQIDPQTVHFYGSDPNDPDNRILRILGGGNTGKTADGGFVTEVNGLANTETYRLTGSVRSSWAVDDKHQCFVGFDPTGQTSDPEAASIVWRTLPAVHGIWTAYSSTPVRPANDAVSVWLRGRTTLNADFPFRADFDNFALRQVRTGVPR